MNYFKSSAEEGKEGTLSNFSFNDQAKEFYKKLEESKVINPVEGDREVALDLLVKHLTQHGGNRNMEELRAKLEQSI